MIAQLVVVVLFVVVTTGLAAYSHEQDLINQCAEKGVISPWSSDHGLACKLTNKDL